MQDAPASVHIDKLPLQGRGVLAALRELQLFGQIAGAGAASLNTITTVPVQDAWNPRSRPGEHCRRLWRLSTAGVAFTRQVDPGPTTPLLVSQFSNPPAGASAADPKILAVRVNVQSASGYRRFMMDIGQTIELYGLESATVDVLGPAGLVSVQNPDTAASIAGLGVFLDAKVGIDAGPVEAATGMREVNFTQMFEVAAGGTLDVPVPRFAVRVKIWKATAGTSSVWTRFVGDPAAALGFAVDAGTIPFASNASLDSHARLGPETFIRADVDALNARTFVVQWTIRP